MHEAFFIVIAFLSELARNKSSRTREGPFYVQSRLNIPKPSETGVARVIPPPPNFDRGKFIMTV